LRNLSSEENFQFKEEEILSSTRSDSTHLRFSGKERRVP